MVVRVERCAGAQSIAYFRISKRSDAEMSQWRCSLISVGSHGCKAWATIRHSVRRPAPTRAQTRHISTAANKQTSDATTTTTTGSSALHLDNGASTQKARVDVVACQMLVPVLE